MSYAISTIDSFEYRKVNIGGYSLSIYKGSWTIGVLTIEVRIIINIIFFFFSEIYEII